MMLLGLMTCKVMEMMMEEGEWEFVAAEIIAELDFEARERYCS